MCYRLCIGVVKTQSGQALVSVKFPCQESSRRCAIHVKGRQRNWNWAQIHKEKRKNKKRDVNITDQTRVCLFSL